MIRTSVDEGIGSVFKTNKVWHGGGVPKSQFLVGRLYEWPPNVAYINKINKKKLKKWKSNMAWPQKFCLAYTLCEWK